jgi:hypothetical protein
LSTVAIGRVEGQRAHCRIKQAGGLILRQGRDVLWVVGNIEDVADTVTGEDPAALCCGLCTCAFSRDADVARTADLGVTVVEGQVVLTVESLGADADQPLGDITAGRHLCTQRRNSGTASTQKQRVSRSKSVSAAV